MVENSQPYLKEILADLESFSISKLCDLSRSEEIIFNFIAEDERGALPSALVNPVERQQQPVSIGQFGLMTPSWLRQPRGWKLSELEGESRAGYCQCIGR